MGETGGRGCRQSKMDQERSREDWDGHTCRANVLNSLGFACYGDYLSSDKWGEIQRRQLFISNWHCECCPGRASFVYHSSSDINVLDGKSKRRDLHSLCDKCYSSVLFDGHRVRSSAEAYRTYMGMRDHHRRKWTSKNYWKMRTMHHERATLYKQSKKRSENTGC